MTNGLDHKTREAIQYWRSCGLDVRPWVYRVYEGQAADEILLEMSPFRVEDNPYEDIAEGHYILNTNISNDRTDHEDMLTNHKAAIYFGPGKYKIARLTKGDVVYLYQSGVGIVAMGKADGKLLKAPYHGNPEHADEEYSMQLVGFRKVDPPMAAVDIKSTTGVDYRFMQTMFGLDTEAGKAIHRFLVDTRRITG